MQYLTLFVVVQNKRVKYVSSYQGEAKKRADALKAESPDSIVTVATCNLSRETLLGKELEPLK